VSDETIPSEDLNASNDGVERPEDRPRTVTPPFWSLSPSGRHEGELARDETGYNSKVYV
jgi:hypothetical protein